MLLNDGNGERAVVYRFMAALFSHAPSGEDLDAIREDLELKSHETEFEIFEDFNRLFASPGGIAPPLESLNNPEAGDAVADSLAAIYAAAGLTFGEEYELVVDHISIEFLFMSYLIETGDLERQEQFLEEHVMSWVPDYCDRVMQEAGTDYYREVIALTKEFVEQEYAGFE